MVGHYDKMSWVQKMEYKGYDGSDVHWMAVKYSVGRHYFSYYTGLRLLPVDYAMLHAEVDRLPPRS